MKVNLSLENRAKKALINSICILIEKNPTKNISKILNLSKSFAKNQATKELITILNNSYNTMDNVKEYIDKSFKTTDINILKKIIINLSNTENKKEEDKDFFVPFSIIINPSSKCNLKCEKSCTNQISNNLTYDDIDKTVSEARNIGINCIFILGGEPFYVDFMYDIYKKYNDILFIPFTNGTLFSKETANKILNLGNLFPIILLDGLKEYTDNLCGDGTFNRIMNGMDILNSYSIPFGVSTNTLKTNIDEVISHEFIDLLINKNSKLTIYSSLFRHNYDSSMLLTHDECINFSKRINNIRNSKPYFVIDLFNDDKYIQSFLKANPGLKNTSIYKYEQHFCSDVSKYNINSMTLKDMLTIINNNMLY